MVGRIRIVVRAGGVVAGHAVRVGRLRCTMHIRCEVGIVVLLLFGMRIVAVDCLALLLPLLFEITEYCFNRLDHPLVAFIIIITSKLCALAEQPIRFLLHFVCSGCCV